VAMKKCRGKRNKKDRKKGEEDNDSSSPK